MEAVIYKFEILDFGSQHIYIRAKKTFLISNFRPVLNVVCFLLGNSPASEVYMPTFRNTLFHLPAYEDGTDGVPKRRHINFRRRGITQKKAYNEADLT